MTVGQNIKRIRMEKNLTQTMLSTRMGYTSNSVLSKLENDHLEPNTNHLRRLALALKVSQASILNVDNIEDTSTLKEEVVKVEKNVKQEAVAKEEVKEVVVPKEIHEEKSEDQVIEKEENPISTQQEEHVEILHEKSEDVVKEETNTDVHKGILTMHYPFYNNALTIILSLLLILAPISILLIKDFSNQKEVLMGSCLVLVVLLVSLLMNISKIKKCNITIATKASYGARTTKGKLAMLKTLVIVISLAFIAAGYFYITKVKGLIVYKNLLYVLYALLGISGLIKLLATLSISLKNPTDKISANNGLLVLTFIIDVVATLGLVIYLMLSNKTVVVSNVTYCYIVTINLISYILILINNKYSSLFKLI